jgi:hypothetical protein
LEVDLNLLGFSAKILSQDNFQMGRDFVDQFDNKIPENGSGLNGNNLYIDEFGNLIIEFINLNSDEQIEVELSTSGTIYTVQFNGGES